MTATAETAGAQHGTASLWWGVYDRNTEACRFYERLGATYVNNVRFMSVDVDALLHGRSDTNE